MLCHHKKKKQNIQFASFVVIINGVFHNFFWGVGEDGGGSVVAKRVYRKVTASEGGGEGHWNTAEH